MQKFFDAIRPQFGGRLTSEQVEGLNRLMDATRGLPLAHRAYILATAQHETAHTMQPVRETRAATDASAITILENAWAKGRLPWVKTPYWRRDAEGKSWLGRGYVQLTHRDNYARAGAKLGVDLLTDPNAAMRPAVAAQILVRGMLEGWFTGKKLSDYASYEAMRRVVNGTDRAKAIADLARGYEAALAVLPQDAPRPAKKPGTTSPAPSAKPQNFAPTAAMIFGGIALVIFIAVILGVN